MHGHSPDARGALAVFRGLVCVAMLAGLLVFGLAAPTVAASGGPGATAPVSGALSDGAEQLAAADVEVRAPARRTAPAHTVWPSSSRASAAVPVPRVPPVGAADAGSRGGPSLRALRCVVLRC
jgi:hypothetical protein